MNLQRNALAAAVFAALVTTAACSQTGEPPKGQAAQKPPAEAPPAGAPAQAPAPAGPVSGHTPTPAAGGEQLPPGHPQVGMPPAPAIAPPPEGTGQGDKALVWTLPARWKEQPPSSRMRRAQFRVPGADGDPEDGECVVFYFGPGGGGPPEDNASRWVDQFTQPDGSSSQGRAKIAMRTIGGKEVLFVEVKGTYNSSVMGGSRRRTQAGLRAAGRDRERPGRPLVLQVHRTGEDGGEEPRRVRRADRLASPRRLIPIRSTSPRAVRPGAAGDLPG